MCFHNLQTHHFPGTHEYATISQALTTAASDWCINFDKQLVAFKCIVTCLCKLRLHLQDAESYFHKSRVDNDEYKKNQLMFSDVLKHKLIHDVVSCWNSAYNMIKRVCK